MLKKISIFLFLGAMFYPSLVSAQIFIENSKIHLDVAPNSTTVDKVTVQNSSNKSIHLRVYWEDFMYVKPFDGKKNFMPRGTSPYSLSEWITFFPTEITIPPFAKKNIKFTIKTPANAKGGHYGVLFLESLPEASNIRVGLSVVFRMGALFFVETLVKDKTSKINQLTNNTNEFQGTFTNLGNIILIPEASYYIINTTEYVVDRGSIKKFYLPPNETASFKFNIDKDLIPGKYTAVLTFDLLQGDSIVKEIDFIKKKDASVEIIATRD